MIEYVTSAADIRAEQLQGFWVGWPSPPSPQTHLRLLQQSDHIALAVDSETRRVVGFITAVSDRTLFAYIPLLEVLPEYQGQSIGQALVERMMEQLSGYYHVSLTCDPPLQPFYERMGMQRTPAMLKVNFRRQSGE